LATNLLIFLCLCCLVNHPAKNVVASGLATKCSVQLAYAIGMAKPMSIYVNTFGTGVISDEKLSVLVEKVFDFTPKGMVEGFGLLSGDVYRKISKTLFMDDYAWEKTDLAERLKKEAGNEK